jgi:DNA adenine methylase
MTSRRAPALFNWAGSKARVAKALCGLELPTIGTYHEPFLGSGAAFLGLASAGLVSKSFLSDVNPRLVNVFQATKSQPYEVVAGLRMHALLDSDVHFSAVLGRLNSRPAGDMVDCQVAADTIYLLSQSFHSTWYETRDGQVSMSRRRGVDAFRARHEDVVRAAALLEEATVQLCDFRHALDRVGAGDLVFVDPPYLYGDDQVDQQSYNVNRFGVSDVRVLSAEMRRLVDLGAHVIFCWGERADALVPDRGVWTEIGRDFVWLSESLTLRMNAADRKDYRSATQRVAEGTLE